MNVTLTIRLTDIAEAIETELGTTTDFYGLGEDGESTYQVTELTVNESDDDALAYVLSFDVERIAGPSTTLDYVHEGIRDAMENVTIQIPLSL